MKQYIFPLLILILFVTSCVDIPKFSDTPRIEYVGIDKILVLKPGGAKDRDSVIITVSFEDGDGDLGVGPTERDTLKYPDWGNFELVTVTKLSNGDSLEYIKAVDKYKWIPTLKTDGKPGPIKGKLDLSFVNIYLNSSQPTTNKYRVRIRDRAFHVSNQITTDTVVVPEYR